MNTLHLVTCTPLHVLRYMYSVIPQSWLVQSSPRFSLAGTRTQLRDCWWAESRETLLLLHLSVHVGARGSRGCDHEFNATVTALKLNRDAVCRSRQKGKSPSFLGSFYTRKRSVFTVMSMYWFCNVL